MHNSDPHTFGEWFNLMVDDRLLASIKGKETAEWFLLAMSYGNKTGEKYSLIPKDDADLAATVDSIEAIKPW